MYFIANDSSSYERQLYHYLVSPLHITNEQANEQERERERVFIRKIKGNIHLIIKMQYMLTRKQSTINLDSLEQ